MVNAALQSGLDYVFGFFERGYRRQAGRLDREVRRPEVFATIAGAHQIFPPHDRTILITGSKGKGTCARLVSAYLRQQGKRVGLVLTPEERHHLDRIRIDGQPIASADFLRLLETFKPALEETADHVSNTYYHPPTSIFLLIALKYFQERQVDFVVVEGGRGAQYDEIGQLPAEIGIVTSILPEHLGKLGPALKDICNDKFSLAHSCRTLICSQQAWSQACVQSATIRTDNVMVADESSSTESARPAWLATADALGRAVIIALGLKPGPFPQEAEVFASCQVITSVSSPMLQASHRVFLDGAITAACLDFDYIHSTACAPQAIVFGMSADKDATGIVEAFTANGFDKQFFFQPVSATAHVSPSSIVNDWAGSFDTETGFDDESRAALLHIIAAYERVYVVGVQIFLRSIRNALLPPGENP